MFEQRISRKRILLKTCLILLFLISQYWITMVERTVHFELLTSYSISFIAMICLVYQKRINWKWILGIGVVARLLFITGEPKLSDDYYRFFWDGMLSYEEIPVFKYKPNELMETDYFLQTENEFKRGIYDHLNSQQFYSVYPTINQSLFLGAFYLSKYNLKIFAYSLQVFFLLIEVLTFFMLLSILKLLKVEEINSVWYFLNPLVIIEGVGNLHFEVILVCFLAITFVLLIKNKWLGAGLTFSLGVLTKLYPILLLPFLFRPEKRNSWLVYVLTCVMVVVGFLLFKIDPISLFESVKLYFQYFEFNASFYYLFREMGYMISGYNQIAIVGPLMQVLMIGMLMFLFFKSDHSRMEVKLFSLMMVLFVYQLFATTIHPWYIIPILFIGVLLKSRAVVVWSFLVFFTYLNYKTTGTKESVLFIFIEYVSVLGVLFYDWKNIKKAPHYEELLSDY